MDLTNRTLHVHCLYARSLRGPNLLSPDHIVMIYVCTCGAHMCCNKLSIYIPQSAAGYQDSGTCPPFLSRSPAICWMCLTGGQCVWRLYCRVWIARCPLMCPTPQSWLGCAREAGSLSQVHVTQASVSEKVESRSNTPHGG